MMMGSKASCWRPACIALIACLVLVLAGCGGSGSRLSTGTSPLPAPTGITSSTSAPSATAATATGGTSTGGTVTVGPASTVSAVPGTGGGAPPIPAPRPPTSSSSTVAPPAPAGSGAYGYVTAGPTCPVERPDQPCLPRPVSAHIQAQDPSGSDVAGTDSDSSGRYRLVLPPGTYTLTATAGTAYPRCQPAHVTVNVGLPSRADISCDTGIR
jgi:Carboxypeptidase regulatory-like domain